PTSSVPVSVIPVVSYRVVFLFLLPIGIFFAGFELGFPLLWPACVDWLQHRCAPKKHALAHICLSFLLCRFLHLVQLGQGLWAATLWTTSFHVAQWCPPYPARSALPKPF